MGERKIKGRLLDPDNPLDDMKKAKEGWTMEKTFELIDKEIREREAEKRRRGLFSGVMNRSIRVF